MRHKFNASRRHKFENKRQKVTNWRVYNEGLRQHDDVTIWLSAEVEVKWLADSGLGLGVQKGAAHPIAGKQ